MPQPIEVLGAMITPAVLISAAALLLLSTAARMGRVHERLQHLISEVERRSDPPPDPEQRHFVLEQMRSLVDRLLLLRAATGIYCSIALLVVTSITSGMYLIFPAITSLTPIALGLLGAIAFLYSLVVLIQEAVVAVRVTMREADYVKRLLADRDA